MKRLMCSVVLLASLSFADRIEIDLPVSEDGWDHEKAAFIGVNLKSYVGEYQIQSATLQFTGLQNLMEPETNDILHINLLKSNVSSTDPLVFIPYGDGHEQSNYFENKNNSEFSWLGSASYLGSYTDINDENARIEYYYKQPNWERSPEHAWEKINGLKNGYYWRYERWDDARPRDLWWLWNPNSNNHALWSKYSGWTTDSLSIELDVNLINNLMTSSNGWIGFGLDADCHYIGNAKLIVTTVPEPGTLSLMFLGLTTLTGAFLIRKRK